MPDTPIGEPHLSDSGSEPNPADAILGETAQRSDQQITPQITAPTDGRIIRATRVTAAATTAIFVANVVFAVFAWKQWNAMENALDLNRQTFAASQRPFVYYHRVNYAFFDRKGTEGKDLQATAVWGNSGNTPTTHLKQMVGCLPNQGALDEPFDDMHFDTAKGVPMVYGPKTEIDLGGVCKISYEAIQTINRQASHFYMCGVVTYGDIIDQSAEHKTEFCYELTGIDWTDAAKNTGFAVGRHNCADADCP